MAQERDAQRADSDEGGARKQSSRMTSTGITLIGVWLSIGATVGMEIDAVWWVHVVAGVVAAMALRIVIRLATSTGPRGLLARAARWNMSAPD
jgi:uncharacterized membrane-anchored protein YitT (DUF2179 family)